MGEIFGKMYCFLFEDFFGLDLAQYLWGGVSPYSENNSYIGLGLAMLGITAAMIVLFYYILDLPKLAKWWGWAIFLGGNAVINFFVGWQMVLSDFYGGKMVAVDQASGAEEAMKISESNILCFGIANMLLAIFWFIVFTFLFKWWSTNCKHAPV